MERSESKSLRELRESVVRIILITTAIVIWPILIIVVLAGDYITTYIGANTTVINFGMLLMCVGDTYLLYRFHKTKNQNLGVYIIAIFFIASIIFLVNDPYGMALITYLLISTLMIVFIAILYGRRLMIFAMTIVAIATFMIRWIQIDIGQAINDISFFPIILVIGIFVDLSMSKFLKTLDDLETTKKQIEENLKTIREQQYREQIAKQRLDLVVSNISEAVVLVDSQLKIKLINGLGINYLNLRVEDTLDLNKFVDDRTNEVIDIMPNLFSSGDTQHIEEHLQLKVAAKNVMPVEVLVSPVWIDSKIEFGLIIIRDISERIEIDQMKSEFVSIASHQLKTPLTAIKWHLENLDGEFKTEDQFVNQTITTISNSTDRMIDLINDLLNTSRIDRGAFKELHIEKFNLTELITKVIDQNFQNKEQRNINVNYSKPELPVDFNGDKEKIFEAISNLVSNAIKYSSDNSEVSVNVKTTNENILIEVSDSGIGIPESDQSKIFKKFFRAQNAREKLADGNGIGLYVVKNFVEAHGGTISFISSEDKGTTFYIKLPLA